VFSNKNYKLDDLKLHFEYWVRSNGLLPFFFKFQVLNMASLSRCVYLRLPLAGSLLIVHTLLEDSGLYVCHVTSQVLDKSVLSRPLELEVIGE